MSSVKLEFSIWVIDQNSLTGEIWMLSFLGDEYEGVSRKFVVNAKVGYFSAFRNASKKLSLMSPARDTRLRAPLSEDLVTEKTRELSSPRTLELHIVPKLI